MPRGDEKAKLEEFNKITVLTPEGLATRKWRISLSLGFGFFAFVIYALTLYPSVPGGDSGELIAAAHTLGVAHPPGYPLFILLGKIFSLLPFGSVAWRINLLSAACDSAAAVLLCLAVTSWSDSLWAGLLSAGLFAFSPLVWSYAIAAEVFALNNLFLAGLIFLWSCYQKSPSRRTATLMFFWTGLGLCNHHTFLFVSFPILGWILWQSKRELLSIKSIAMIGVAFLCGLIPYLYLPIAASQFPVINWGDCATIQGFFHHVLRKDYGTFQLGSSAYGRGGELFARMYLYLQQLPSETLFVGVVLAIVGAIASPAILVSAFFVYLLCFCYMSNLRLDIPLHLGIQARFWQQANVIVFVWIGMGASAIYSKVRAEVRAKSEVACGVATIIAILLQISLNYSDRDQSNNFIFRDLARGLLGPLPANTLLLTRDDHLTNAVRYLQSGENFRPDVKIIDQMLLTYGWQKQILAHTQPEVILPRPGVYMSGGFTMRDFFDANYGRFPLFVANGFVANETSYLDKYSTWTVGMNEVILPKNQIPNMDEFYVANQRLFAAFDVHPSEQFAESTWEDRIQKLYWVMRYRFAEQLLTRALANPMDDKTLKYAMATYEDIEKNHKKPLAHLFKNMGLGYQALSKFDSLAHDKMIRAWEHYIELATPGDPEVPSMRRYIAQESTPSPFM